MFHLVFRVFVPLLFLEMVVISHPQFPKIPPELQNLNFEQYLKNERVMKFQLKCLLYNGPCDTIGKTLKREIPIFLKTLCRECTDEQKSLVKKFILFMQQNYPKEWDDAVTKYGKGEYSEQEIQEFENNLGVKINRDKNTPTIVQNIDDLVQQAKEQQQVSNKSQPAIPVTMTPSTNSTMSTPDSTSVPNTIPETTSETILETTVAPATVTLSAKIPSKPDNLEVVSVPSTVVIIPNDKTPTPTPTSTTTPQPPKPTPKPSTSRPKTTKRPRPGSNPKNFTPRNNSNFHIVAVSVSIIFCFSKF